MGYDRTAPKRPVNMTINVDLIRRAKGLTSNLSEMVEGLLASYIDAEETRRADLQQQMRQWAEASADVVARFGCPADEYDPF